MPCECLAAPKTVDRVAHLLEAIKDIDVGDVEQLMQRAHECDIHQVDDPPERMTVTRQALRMFWHFRCNLESVEVTPARE